MDEKHLYEVDLEWTDTRRGSLNSPVLNKNIEVATPPEFPNGIEGIWSPEHLFVSAVSSCLMTTFLAISEYSKLDFLAFTVNAIGTLEKVDGKFVITEIELKPVLDITNEAKKAKALRIIEKAEAACLISNSITSKIILNPTINIKEPELIL
ncbi:MAG: OsmC family protein [Balneolaceae bacterium]